MRKLLTVCSTLGLLLCAAGAQAQDRPFVPLPEGQTLLNVSATERTQVQQDTLIASMNVTKNGADPRTIQNEINTLMQQALVKAKAVNGIEVSNGQYYVYQDAPEPPPAPMKERSEKRTPLWHGTQSIELKGKQADDILKVAGELQDMGLVMNGLNYTLSPAKADEAQESLMESALAKVRQKAERAAKALGKTKVELSEVSVDAVNNVMPMMRMSMKAEMAPAAEMQPPSAEPGMADIELTVSARALLKP